MNGLEELLSDPAFTTSMSILSGNTPGPTRPNLSNQIMTGMNMAQQGRDASFDRMTRDLEFRMKLNKYKKEQQQLEMLSRMQGGMGGAQGLPPTGTQGLPTAGAQVPQQMSPSGLPQVDNSEYVKSLDDRIAQINEMSRFASTPEEFNNLQKERMDLMKEKKTLSVNNRQYRFMVRTENGEFLPVFSTNDGLVVSQNGRDVPYNPGMGTPATPSQGRDWSKEILGADKFNALETEYDNSIASLESLDRLAKYVNAGPEGLERIKSDWTAKLRALFGEDLSPEQLALRLQNSQARQLIGQSRIDLFGGGPLTESEAELAMQILLSSPTSFSKQQALTQLTDFYQQKKRRHNLLERQLTKQYSLKYIDQFPSYSLDNMYLENLPGYFQQYPENDPVRDF